MVQTPKGSSTSSKQGCKITIPLSVQFAKHVGVGFERRLEVVAPRTCARRCPLPRDGAKRLRPMIQRLVYEDPVTARSIEFNKIQKVF